MMVVRELMRVAVSRVVPKAFQEYYALYEGGRCFSELYRSVSGLAKVGDGFS